MNIAVFGLGYIGSVTAASLARDGHAVLGVDISCPKVEAFQKGQSPIGEPGLNDLIHDQVQSGRLRATDDAHQAVQFAELIFVCVGTPSGSNGSLDLSAVESVCATIGDALADKKDYAVVAIRSTVLPNTTHSRLIPTLEQHSGERAGQDFGFCVNPEFLREGSAIQDFEHPPHTIIGEADQRSGDLLVQLYQDLDAPLYRVPVEAAEMVKYASNAFHALKVTFANEIGNICQAYDIDSHQVMEIFANDSKLNISPRYLKPGFAFGGPCLGKDLRALLYSARKQDIKTPVLASILPSNEMQVAKVVEALIQSGKRKVGLIGLSFKPNSDDLRESPAVELSERLLGKGMDLKIYDRALAEKYLNGGNKDQLTQSVPHLAPLLQSSIDPVLTQSEVLVITKPMNDEDEERLLSKLQPDQMLFDLVRLDPQEVENKDSPYFGISW